MMGKILFELWYRFIWLMYWLILIFYWLVPLNLLSQVCQTLFQTHTRSKQVLISNACRCTHSAVLPRRTVWPGNLWWSKCDSVLQHAPIEADWYTHWYFLCFYCFLKDNFTCFSRRISWNCIWLFYINVILQHDVIRRHKCYGLLSPKALSAMEQPHVLHYAWTNYVQLSIFQSHASVFYDPSKVSLWTYSERHWLQSPPTVPPDSKEPRHQWLPPCQAEIWLGLAQLSPVGLLTSLIWLPKLYFLW